MHIQFRFIGTVGLACLGSIVMGTGVAGAQVTYHGSIVIPAEGFAIDGDSVADATIKSGVFIRSAGGQVARAAQQAMHAASAPAGGLTAPLQAQIKHSDNSRVNAQINDPQLDHITSFPSLGTRAFEFATQSETSVVARGRHIIVGYNSSAGSQVQYFPGFGLAYTQLLFSGYSVSHDHGHTWQSGFIPPVSPDSPFTYGDPSLAMDRKGAVYYASLGTDAAGNSAIIVGRSTDNGASFGPATLVVQDDGSDKEWLAIGPDPGVRNRDNLYITWTSFGAAGSTLNLSRSLDGGTTWSPARVLFTPADDGVNSSYVQFSNPIVDQATGRLYIPFLHFSDIDADNVRVLVSDDGGATFKFLAFNVAGAPDAFAFPVVTPGVLNDCFGGGIRNVLHQGAAGTGRFGFPQYTQATRLITQPAAAVWNGRLVITLNSSTSPFFGDPSAGSQILLLYSPDGGQTWAPQQTVAASTGLEPQHVHPAIALNRSGSRGWVIYYAQRWDERLKTRIAKLKLFNSQASVGNHADLSTTTFNLTPSNIRLAPDATTNFDRVVATCYDIGEYASVATARHSDDGEDWQGLVSAWGDNRNSWTGPADSSAPYTHAQPDVFFGTFVDD